MQKGFLCYDVITTLWIHEDPFDALTIHNNFSIWLLSSLWSKRDISLSQISNPSIEGILPKGPYPPCLRMADRALLAGYPRIIVHEKYRDNERTICLRRWTVLKKKSLSYFFPSDVHCITLFSDIYLFSVALTKRAITGKLKWPFIWKDNHRQRSDL